MEALPYDKYSIRMDGSGRVTCRNRRYIRRYTPISLSVRKNEQNTPAATAPQIHDTCEATPRASQWPRSDVSTKPSEKIAESLTESQPQIAIERDVPELIGAPTPDDECMVATPARNLSSPERKLPLALRRLRDFNTPGLKE